MGSLVRTLFMALAGALWDCVDSYLNKYMVAVLDLDVPWPQRLLASGSFWKIPRDLWLCEYISILVPLCLS